MNRPYCRQPTRTIVISFHVGEVPPIARLTVIASSAAIAAVVIVPVATVPAVSENGALNILVPPFSRSTVNVGVVPPEARALACTMSSVILYGAVNLTTPVAVAVYCPDRWNGITSGQDEPAAYCGGAASAPSGAH